MVLENVYKGFGGGTEFFKKRFISLQGIAII